MNEFLSKDNEKRLMNILKKRNIKSMESDLVFFYNTKENELKDKSLVEMGKMFIDWKINSATQVSNNLESLINERKYDVVIKREEYKGEIEVDPKVKRIQEIKKKMKGLMNELDNLLYEL
jgi:hypothetical protein